MSFLANLLPFFVYPLSGVLIISAAALTLSFTSWWRSGQVLLGVALGALWIAATPVFAKWLNWRLESRFPPAIVETLPQSDVVILLSGGPSNRILHALRIYKAGKAPLILISGASQSWQRCALTGAEPITEVLVGLGVPLSALMLETESRNTRENAVNTAAIFKAYGWRSGILVTSGSHMPRALAAFRKVGLNLVPAATDIYAGAPNVDSFFDLLPDAKALVQSTLAIKEMIGMIVYSVLGWAD
jgi:uncharacterized SAM-binding protein YcdF (DUF218 family)